MLTIIKFYKEGKGFNLEISLGTWYLQKTCTHHKIHPSHLRWGINYNDFSQIKREKEITAAFQLLAESLDSELKKIRDFKRMKIEKSKDVVFPSLIKDGKILTLTVGVSSTILKNF